VEGRFVTAAVTALVVASCAGCGSDKAPENTARVTVDNTTSVSHAITCNQVQWMLTANIDTGPKSVVQVMLNLNPDKPKSNQPQLEAVNIENFVGFTGVADSGAGDAKATFANGRYTVTGTAKGSKLNDPRVSMTAPFKIEVGC
jgi:ipoprotein LpqH